MATSFVFETLDRVLSLMLKNNLKKHTRIKISVKFYKKS